VNGSQRVQEENGQADGSGRRIVWRIHGELDCNAYGPVQGDREVHARDLDKNSMYATEELWFEEHDMQGTPWSAPENYKKWAPMTYAAALGKFKTPTLVVGRRAGLSSALYAVGGVFSARCSGRECRRNW